jgi:hypothetical protein
VSGQCGGCNARTSSFSVCIASNPKVSLRLPRFGVCSSAISERHEHQHIDWSRDTSWRSPNRWSPLLELGWEKKSDSTERNHSNHMGWRADEYREGPDRLRHSSCLGYQGEVQAVHVSMNTTGTSSWCTTVSSCTSEHRAAVLAQSRLIGRTLDAEIPHTRSKNKDEDHLSSKLL